MRMNQRQAILMIIVSWGLAPTPRLFAQATRPATSTAPAESFATKDIVVPLYYSCQGFPLGLAPGDQYTKKLLDSAPRLMKSIPKPGDGKRYWGEILLGQLNEP